MRARPARPNVSAGPSQQRVTRARRPTGANLPLPVRLPRRRLQLPMTRAELWCLAARPLTSTGHAMAAPRSAAPKLLPDTSQLLPHRLVLLRNRLRPSPHCPPLLVAWPRLRSGRVPVLRFLKDPLARQKWETRRPRRIVFLPLSLAAPNVSARLVTLKVSAQRKWIRALERERRPLPNQRGERAIARKHG